MTARLSAFSAAILIGAATSSVCATASSDVPKPHNFVEITPQIATSAQPNAAFLESLKAQGFGAVIFIAPPTVGNAVKEEPLIVGKQGLLYANVPVNFMAPTAADFKAFSGVLAAWQDRKVLVHCQANLRASVFVFLYRVLHDKEPPEKAYEAVRRVWNPEPVWREFLIATLKANGIAFDPL
jgi:protein tyrosine phosphatase (PTP) superfamily phosphohydrolase (DUF442 family)